MLLHISINDNKFHCSLYITQAMIASFTANVYRQLAISNPPSIKGGLLKFFISFSLFFQSCANGRIRFWRFLLSSKSVTSFCKENQKQK